MKAFALALAPFALQAKDPHKMMQERADAKGMKMPDRMMKRDGALCAKMANAQAASK